MGRPARPVFVALLVFVVVTAAILTWVVPALPPPTPPWTVNGAIAKVGVDFSEISKIDGLGEVPGPCVFLIQTGPSAIPDLILAHKASTHPIRRELLAMCMVEIGDTRGLDYLAEVLADPLRPDDIQYVAKYAHRIRAKSIIAQLVDYMDHPSQGVRYEVLAAMRRLVEVPLPFRVDGKPEEMRVDKQEWKTWWAENHERLVWDPGTGRWVVRSELR